MDNEYYTRIMSSPRWISKGDGIGGITGEAITTDLRADENQWSVFRCTPKFTFTDAELDLLFIQYYFLLIHRIKFPMTIVFLEKEYIESAFGKIADDPTEFPVSFGFCHCEIQPVQYKKIGFLAQDVFNLFSGASVHELRFSEYELDMLLDALLKHWKDVYPQLLACKSKQRKSIAEKMEAHFKGQFTKPQYKSLFSDLISLKDGRE